MRARLYSPERRKQKAFRRLGEEQQRRLQVLGLAGEYTSTIGLKWRWVIYWEDPLDPENTREIIRIETPDVLRDEDDTHFNKRYLHALPVKDIIAKGGYRSQRIAALDILGAELVREMDNYIGDIDATYNEDGEFRGVGEGPAAEPSQP